MKLTESQLKKRIESLKKELYSLQKELKQRLNKKNNPKNLPIYKHIASMPLKNGGSKLVTVFSFHEKIGWSGEFHASLDKDTLSFKKGGSGFLIWERHSWEGGSDYNYSDSGVDDYLIYYPNTK